MQFSKMMKVMAYLMGNGVKPQSQIGVTAGGELVLYLTEQPARDVHNTLLKWGFITVDADYVYRPR